jgi:phenylacetate-CoA ligase
MNPFLNPVFLWRIAKGYFMDISRLQRLNEDQLVAYQSKQLRKMVDRAFSVPMYKTIYERYGVEKKDIQIIEDLSKLPVITKDDFSKFDERDLIPINRELSDFVKVSTSGTTGKSLSLYVDMYDIIMGLFGYLRTIKDYGISWRKEKITIIGDFAPHTAETGYVKRGLLPHLIFKNLFSTIQWLDTNGKPEDIMAELNAFQPAFIGGYAGMLGHLAVLKSRGEGGEVNPRLIASTGAVLDSNLKQFIEDSFQAKVFEVYGATETGPIAYQCEQKGIYHVMSDFLYVECLDETYRKVPSKSPGHLVVTKLYGGGTPIIRYNAINDIVAPLYEKHDCHLSGALLHRIYGRDTIRLFRKDGKIVLSSSLTSIFSRLIYELQTSKIREMKVIQESLDRIIISVVVDDSLRDEEPSLDSIFSLFQKGFKQVFGESVSIVCREIDSVDRDEPRIISKVDPSSMKLTGFV